MEGTVKYSLNVSPMATEASSLNSSFAASSPSISSSSLNRVKQVWAVGGGKGGVGKSLIASSLAISLTRMGNKVVAIDLDLGGANLHTTLGVNLPKQTLSDYFSQRVPNIESCIVPSGISHLQLISGAQDSVGITNIRNQQKTDFLKNVRRLDAD